MNSGFVSNAGSGSVKMGEFTGSERKISEMVIGEQKQNTSAIKH
jgi:hypothetical protein